MKPAAPAGDPEAAAKLEAGRLLFARPWKHFWGSSDVSNLPPMAGIEVAFAGRSNVGKSSLINALVGQKALARTSNTPGRTRELNFFTAEGASLTIVDMPGYGYARAPKAQVAAWTSLVFSFLRGRQTLRRVYVLIDSRHGLKDNDIEAVKLIDKAAVSYQIVLTKTDKLKVGEIEAVTASVAATIAKHAAAHPSIIATSADAGIGIDALRAEIAALS
ncbi:MAG: ribosome biogenesis GTP-binding protein YihA/YsxC [Bauldia sp.]